MYIKSIVTGLTDKKSCKKQKKIILKKKLLSIINKTKKLQKKSQESIIKTCHKKKMTRLKSIEKEISRISSI